MTEQDKLKMCEGCRDNFYNGTGAKQCWSLPTAQVVTRYRIGWWTAPTVPGAYTKVQTLHCHHAPGQYAMHEKPAECATEVRNG
jgi:hypothetical protein